MMMKIFLLAILLPLITQAADWPTAKGSISRSGRSSETLSLPLHIAWSHTSAHPPAPAWPAPANLNFATGQLLENAMTYDRCYHSVIANGKLYYGSSADDTIYCINAKTGDLIWKFVTGAPVRIPPAISGNSLFAGSDDGNLYCLDLDTGKQLWKYTGGPIETLRARMLIGNGRMISRWPIRCGIVVDDGALYFTSGLFPVEGVFLHALKIADGSEIWRSEIDVSAQGHMLASRDTLFITTGRNTPVSSFSRTTGKKINHYGQTKSWGKDLTGGSDAILIDDQLISGPSEGIQAHVYDIAAPSIQVAKLDAIGVIANATSIYSVTPLFAGQEVFQLKSFHRAINQENLLIQSVTDKFEAEAKTLKSKRDLQTKELKEQREATKEIQDKLEAEIAHIDAALKALEEKIKKNTALKKNVWQWKTNVKRPYSLLLDTNSLYAGFDGYICAYSLADGSEIWKQELKGRVYGMSISDGALFASTDQGAVYCLKNDVEGTPKRSSVAGSTAEGSVLPKILQTTLKEYGLSQRPGFCLIVDSVDGTLASAAAASTGCRVIAISSDPVVTERLRNRFSKAGIYGSRVVVHEITGSELPYPPCFADLIMSEAAFINGKLPSAPKQLCNYVRPDGGLLALTMPSAQTKQGALEDWGKQCFQNWSVVTAQDWSVGIFRRAALEGAGSWTHAYGDGGGTASSGDATINQEMDIQWFGEPGPSGMVDRHFRTVPPLYSNGRLFVPGYSSTYGVNPYNGTVLWEKEIPDSRRLGPFLDAGSMAVDENNIYVAAADQCVALDVESGTLSKTYQVPAIKMEGALQWGLVGQTGELLLGSTCMKGASYSEQTKAAYNFFWYSGMRVVTSVNVFALDKETAEKRWVYSGGKILNTTIVFNDKTLYFLEVSGSTASTSTVSRMKVSELFTEGTQEIVALSIATGKEIFRRKINALDFTEPVYLQVASGTLLLSGSKPENKALRYTLYAYNAETGEDKWQTSHICFETKANDGHGQQNRHPVIMNSTAYAWPYAYNLDTGKKVENWVMDRRGHGCGGVSGSGNSLFWRGGNPWMIAPESGESAKRLTQVTRPGCWINIIPAGGLIMIPEASSGCTCGYSIQTSLTFGPRVPQQ
ncbi:MAG: PQQ-binding-like beta-propeller repeat protein [Kiritimatiellae bacterium]|nr:PQQ-binding-like beta-propeller repeat protein [Kiritimatiellia bacterium]